MSVRSNELAKAHWNETPLFLQEDERYRIYPWLYEAAEFRRHAGERVLEIGCGTGSDLLQFAKHGAIATGVDITPRHLELARQRVDGRASVIEADATRLPFADASFDFVYSHGVLHHVEDPRPAAAEIMRVLKPGGRLNIHLYAFWSLITFAVLPWKGMNSIENSPAPVHIDLYTARRVRRLFPEIEWTFTKFEAPRLRFAERWLGWFLVAKGQRRMAEAARQPLPIAVSQAK